MGSDRRGIAAVGGGPAVPDLGLWRPIGGRPERVEDAETGWTVTVETGTPQEYTLYALLREQILLLQGRVAALEGAGDGADGADPGAGGE